MFEPFTEGRYLSRWWGPEGFTTTTRAFEFRVGGEWDLVMQGRTTRTTRSGSPVEQYHAIEGGQQTLGHPAAYVTGLVLRGAED